MLSIISLGLSLFAIYLVTIRLKVSLFEERFSIFYELESQLKSLVGDNYTTLETSAEDKYKFSYIRNKSKWLFADNKIDDTFEKTNQCIDSYNDYNNALSNPNDNSALEIINGSMQRHSEMQQEILDLLENLDNIFKIYLKMPEPSFRVSGLKEFIRKSFERAAKYFKKENYEA